MNNLSLYIQAFIYIAAGINHFISPRTYLAIMPPYIPAHGLMVIVSGIAEVLLGIGLLFPTTRSLSAWGLILLLIVVFSGQCLYGYIQPISEVSVLVAMGSPAITGCSNLVGLSIYLIYCSTCTQPLHCVPAAVVSR